MIDQPGKGRYVYCIVRADQPLSFGTIGIGAGVGCDGQVLVMQDLLGLDDRFRPRFVKRYVELADVVRGAFAAYARDVRERRFPADEHSFHGEAPARPTGTGEPGGGYGPV